MTTFNQKKQRIESGVEDHFNITVALRSCCHKCEEYLCRVEVS